ncbi:hypothetical protein MTR67_031278 [Solanum verrucosum]|uniref:Uncharacterized protein n=1 Tax=Solanum verrucosum TaxID=315347 RepID=A0AAF0ZFX1_SOLVR|nr:hypothetical protein MTR67_031278 [Solanum verrucosum]
MTSNVVIKKTDLGAFTILCTVRMLQFSKALCDLGASINLMSYAIFKQLGLGEPKSTTMRLLMADRSIKHPIYIRYDILMKVDRFNFPADLVILDCEIDAEVPIILGRLFLTTGRALVDVESGELKFWINDGRFDFEVKDRKGCKNHVADHLSRMEYNVVVPSERDIEEAFLDESVMMITHGNPPWYVDFANYVVCGVFPDGLNFYQWKRFLFDVKKYFWDEPYLFWKCADHIIRRCVPKVQVDTFLDSCQMLPVGGHHSGVRTTTKVLQSGYYRTTLYQDARSLVKQ